MSKDVFFVGLLYGHLARKLPIYLWFTIKNVFLVYSMVSEHSEKENHIYLLRIDKSCVNGPCSIAMLNNERVATRWFLNMLDR